LTDSQVLMGRPPQEGPRRNNSVILAADASRQAALLVACILPVRALLTPCRAGASTPRTTDLSLRGPSVPNDVNAGGCARTLRGLGPGRRDSRARAGLRPHRMPVGELRRAARWSACECHGTLRACRGPCCPHGRRAAHVTDPMFRDRRGARRGARHLPPDGTRWARRRRDGPSKFLGACHGTWPEADARGGIRDGWSAARRWCCAPSEVLRRYACFAAWSRAKITRAKITRPAQLPSETTIRAKGWVGDTSAGGSQLAKWCSPRFRSVPPNTRDGAGGSWPRGRGFHPYDGVEQRVRKPVAQRRRTVPRTGWPACGWSTTASTQRRASVRNARPSPGCSSS